MQCTVLDLRLTTSVEAAQAYRAGRWAEALALDPTFALAHATLALACFRDGSDTTDLCSRLQDAELHARRSTPQEQRQVEAIVRHVRSERVVSSR